MKSKKKRIVSLLLASALAMSLAGCQGAPQETAQSEEISEHAKAEETTQAAAEEETKSPDEDAEEKADGKMTPWLNTNVAGTVTGDITAELKDDFYLAVNYDYLKDTRIGEGRRGEDSFQETQDIVNERLMKIMTDDTMKGHDAGLLQELYAMWLDWDARNSSGMSQLMPHIEKIRQMGTLEEMTEYLSSQEGVFYGAGLAAIGFGADMDDAQWYCLGISGTSLSLKDSAEYKKLTSIGERYLTVFRERAGLMLEKAGYEEKEAKQIIDSAYDFEESIAPALMSTAETNTPDAMKRIRNKVTMEELEEMSPAYPLTEIIKAMGLGESERINLEQPQWLSKLNELYTEENLEEIKSYILVHTLLEYGELLDEETYREFVKIGNQANGITGSRTDRELALAAVRKFLPTSVSKVYTEEYVGEEIRSDVTNIIQECIGAYRTMLSSEDWLSSKTREKALEKLDNITINAAYPDKWEDTAQLKITSREDGGNYFTAVTEIAAYRMELLKKQVNTKIDREAWADEMLLTEVNAYYNPEDNSINIIAGILGGSFYNSDMTQEEKLANIGAVIGHEISHAFDPMGAQYDKDGNFANWWTDEDYAAFEARAQKLIEYYDRIIPFDGGEHYPGSSVQGEAIADIAGIKSMLFLAKEKEDFDYDAFFRSYARLWKSVYSRETCEFMAYQDVHPLNYLRVNVTIMQQPEFYETYDLKEGDGMYMTEEDRIAVW